MPNHIVFLEMEKTCKNVLYQQIFAVFSLVGCRFDNGGSYHINRGTHYNGGSYHINRGTHYNGGSYHINRGTHYN